MIGPNPSTAASSSSSAARMASIVSKDEASSRALAWPISGMRSPNSSRCRGWRRLASTEDLRFSAETAPNPSMAAIRSKSSRYRSAASASRPSVTKRSMFFSPKNSMSMAARPTKCSMRPLTWRGQPKLTQKVAAAPSSRRSGWPHTGQRRGNAHGAEPSGRAEGTDLTTSGITSPARRTITVSPGRTSLAATWSSLWRVAVVTVTPPTNTGARRAKGVAWPDGPIDTSMSSSSVDCSSGGSL